MNRMFTSGVLLLALTVTSKAQRTNHPAQSATYSIRGTVVGEQDGGPVTGAEVYIRAATEDVAQEAQLADEQGRFHFSGLTAGKYLILGGRKGFVARPYGWHEGYAIAVAVGPNQHDANILLKLEPAASIAGTVYGDEGGPVKGAEIRLYRNEIVNGWPHTVSLTDTSCDGQGHYRFSHLASGTYYLALTAHTQFSAYLQSAFLLTAMQHQGDVEQDGNGGVPPAVLPEQLDVMYPLTFFPDASNSAKAEPVLLHAGERFSADFHLHVVPAAHVKISSEMEARFQVQTFDGDLMQAEVMPVAPQTADWKFVAVAPGAYYLDLEACGSEGCQSGASLLGFATDATIDAGSMTDPEVTVSGTVTSDDGRPLPPDTAVTFIPEHSVAPGKSLRVLTGADGKASSQGVMLPGRYTVQLDDPELWIKNIAVSGDAVRGRTIQKTGDGGLQFSLVVGVGVSSIHGKVVHGGKPAAGAMVLLVPDDFTENPLFRRDESDSDGTFTLFSVPPGNYTALALERGWELEWARPQVLEPFLPKGKHITIVSGENPELVLELR